MGQRVAGEFGGCMNIELLHELSLVEFDGFRRDIQCRGNFFDCVALCHELQDFPLAGRYLDDWQDWKAASYGSAGAYPGSSGSSAHPLKVELQRSRTGKQNSWLGCHRQH